MPELLKASPEMAIECARWFVNRRASSVDSLCREPEVMAISTATVGARRRWLDWKAKGQIFADSPKSRAVAGGITCSNPS
jgi:hypothetical protein